MQNICDATRLAQEARQHVQLLSVEESLSVAHRQDEESKKTPVKKSSKTKINKKKLVRGAKGSSTKKKGKSPATPIMAE